MSLEVWSYLLHLKRYGTVRFWTLRTKPTHSALIRQYSGSYEAVGGKFYECRDKSECLRKANNSLLKKQYGKVFYWKEERGCWGYAVHFPRFESEGIGFINFHGLSHITEIPKELKFQHIFTRSGDHKRYYELKRKNKVDKLLEMV